MRRGCEDGSVKAYTLLALSFLGPGVQRLERGAWMSGGVEAWADSEWMDDWWSSAKRGAGLGWARNERQGL